jgi:HK97 family phage portal protein
MYCFAVRMQGITINDRYRLQREAQFRSGNSTLDQPAQWLLDIFGGNVSKSGVPVNDESALTLSAVYACNRILSDSIASMPVGLFRQADGGDVAPATARPENRLIAVEPSDLYTSYTFRSTLQFHLGMRGNAYARIFRDGRGGARELRILRPNLVTPFWYKGKLYYEILPDNISGYPAEREVLSPDDVLHIAALSTDGVIGRSPISVLRDTIGIGLGNRDYIASIQKNGGRLRGLLKHPNKLGTEQVASLRENFKNAIQQGQFPILENGVEFSSVSLTPADAEFINTAKLTTQDIARVYRIPPHMIGDLERATFSNIEHQSIEFVKNTLLPWIKNWEQELNRKLLPYNLRETHFFRFNVEGMLRGDIRARMEAYTKAIQWGILNRDEVRELENRNRIPDGLGEVFLTPLNMAPLTSETIADPDGGEPSTDNNTRQYEHENENAADLLPGDR